MMDAKKDFIILDVRAPKEWAVSKIEGSISIPMKEIPTRMKELDKTKDIIVTCSIGKPTIG